MSNLIRAALADKRNKDLINSIGKIRGLRRMRRLGLPSGPAASKDKYFLTIELSTQATGKHKITLRPSDFVQNLPAQNAFTIPRGQFTGRNPYDSPLKEGKNPEWDEINEKIEKFLSNLFKTDTLIRLPLPLYDADRNRDKIFKVSSFKWIQEPNKPKWLGNFKFYIRYNAANALHIKIFVHANGKFLENTPLNNLPPSKLPSTTTMGKIKKGCNYHIGEIKNIVNGTIDSSNFERQMRARQRGAHPLPVGPPVVPVIPAPPAGAQTPSRWHGGRKRKTRRKRKIRRKRKTRRKARKKKTRKKTRKR
jgi:hypothetical protein